MNIFDLSPMLRRFDWRDSKLIGFTTLEARVRLAGVSEEVCVPTCKQEFEVTWLRSEYLVV